jgi:hypothetical protein
MSEVPTEQIDLSRHLIKNGPKFRSHTIVIKDNEAHLKPTWPALIFCLIYVVIGLFLLGLAALVYANSKQMDLVIFLLIIGASITTFGITLLHPFMKNISFNKGTGIFNNHVDRPLRLKNIISLQITNKMISSKHGISYPCYELNVLTKYGRRMNILNHNDLQQMQTDAEQLSQFLDIELLDRQKEINL